jgi:hypothetical protein
MYEGDGEVVDFRGFFWSLGISGFWSLFSLGRPGQSGYLDIQCIPCLDSVYNGTMYVCLFKAPIRSLSDFTNGSFTRAPVRQHSEWQGASFSLSWLA